MDSTKKNPQPIPPFGLDEQTKALIRKIQQRVEQIRKDYREQVKRNDG